jgi:DNA-directed RNA polymerase subunit N (RpoN/RPB10)
MIYIKCPSCGLLLGNRQMVYEKGLDEINSNPNTDNDKKLELKTKLVESLGLNRYCCKMRVMTYKNLPEIIH